MNNPSVKYRGQWRTESVLLHKQNDAFLPLQAFRCFWQRKLDLYLAAASGMSWFGTSLVLLHQVNVPAKVACDSL